METLHEFERRNRLFEIVDEEGLRYWDIVRSKVFILLNNHHFNEGATLPLAASAMKGDTFKKVVAALVAGSRLLHWWIINEWNYRLHANRCKWVLIKVSRFIDPETKLPSDAVMDEIQQLLPGKETFVAEVFNNKAFGKIRIGKSPFFAYKTWYLKKLRRMLGIPKKNYEIASLLSKEFSIDLDWNLILSEEISMFKVDYSFFKKMLIRIQPEAIFFTGIQKGLMLAAHDLNVKRVEVQHSPLNKADIIYSYPTSVKYEGIRTLPDYLLTSADIWGSQIFYPVTFKNVGSNYFYNSSVSNPLIKKDYLLVVSGPTYTEHLLTFVTELQSKSKQRVPIFFKLHSAELDMVDMVKDRLKYFNNVEVIYNERSMKDLMQHSFASVMIYSTVAYQAVQMGLNVILLKNGYFEGGYDLFDLPAIRLIDSAKDIDEDELMHMKQNRLNPVRFFDPLNKKEFISFLNMELEGSKN
jgi:hypothetical protein